MSNQLDSIKAEIERAKSALGPTAAARTARGKNVKAATRSRRDSTWRSAVFSVRCKPEIADALRQLAKAEGQSLAELFELMAEARIDRGRK